MSAGQGIAAIAIKKKTDSLITQRPCPVIRRCPCVLYLNGSPHLHPHTINSCISASHRVVATRMTSGDSSRLRYLRFIAINNAAAARRRCLRPPRKRRAPGMLISPVSSYPTGTGKRLNWDHRHHRQSVHQLANTPVLVVSSVPYRNSGS